ncbi:Rne/Rng family ribonuclease [Ornithinimicrobium sp. LYQ103]|uniref:Rne/Rng family ribonuclease n=1 Tax=Ornithinimicrobium sp. LYQ103 TaxID=3378796 RepID=UPI00385232AF
MSDDTIHGTDGRTEDARTQNPEQDERASRASALAAELVAQARSVEADAVGSAEDRDAQEAEQGEDAAEVETRDDSAEGVESQDSDSSDDSDDAAEEEPDGAAEEEPDGEPFEPVAVAEPLPSFGLIFQAPDLTDLPRRRSRRATAGVTAPVERPVQDTHDTQDSHDTQDKHDTQDTETARDSRRAAPDGAETQQDGDDDQGGDDGSSGRNGRRRRRGGKGRRSRGGPDQGEDADGTDADDESAENQTAGDDGDQGDADRGDGEQTGSGGGSRRRSRSGRGRRGPEGQEPSGDEGSADQGGSPDDADGSDDGEGGAGGTRRRRRRRRSGEASTAERPARDEVTSVRGSTRLEAKRQRRREGREAGRRRTIITEAEFLARRESVDRVMVVRGLEDRTQIAVLEDGVTVEHYVSRSAQSSTAGNVYLGRVQNVLPSMEAAFVDIGKGRNAVLYAGEVNWDAAGLDSKEPKRIENALKPGQSVLVQVTKDPIGHKGARLTSQVSLPGRYLVYVPGNAMTGISRKLPDTERARLKRILKEVVPDDAGVIVRTAAEGASEAELRADVERLTATWERIDAKAKAKSSSAPTLLHGEPDMTVRVIRDVFTEDFSRLIVSGDEAWTEVKRYIDDVAPDLADRVEKYTGTTDIFTAHRVSESIAKAMDRKVWLPSGGSLVIDRTEAMTVVDVNTGKFTGSGGNLEETVTKNNIEAAEEIVRQLRLRDIGGIIVIDFIDMVLESNRELVVRRLLECLGRDRTKHQVAEVTSLGLVQMTRKRVGSGLIEVFSDTCVHCAGRGIIVQTEPTAKGDAGPAQDEDAPSSKRGRGKGRASGSGGGGNGSSEPKNVLPTPNPKGPTPAQIAAAAHAAALHAADASAGETSAPTVTVPDGVVEAVEAVLAADSPEPEASPGAMPETERPTPEPQPEPTHEPAPAPKRRRRGRVLAPAGPPTGVEEDRAGSTEGSETS